MQHDCQWGPCVVRELSMIKIAIIKMTRWGPSAEELSRDEDRGKIQEAMYL
jgi:hypothetical protein